MHPLTSHRSLNEDLVCRPMRNLYDVTSTSSHPQHIKSTSSVSAEPRRAFQHRRKSDDPLHRSYQVVLRITTPNPKCAMLAAAARSLTLIRAFVISK